MGNSEKRLPLVPGCKALMLPTIFQEMREVVFWEAHGAAPNIVLPAHEVTVIDRCPLVSRVTECLKCSRGEFWYIESPLMSHVETNGVVNCACQLVRIDGGEFHAERDARETAQEGT